MGNLENSIEIVKAERVVKAKVADSPSEGKTPEELKRELIEKELLENREIIEALKPKETKEALKSELVEHETKPMEEHSVEPVKNPNETCPFCSEEKSAQGMNRHIAAIHEIEGVSIEDLGRVERGEITPADLAWEKSDYEGSAMVRALSPEISKKYFSDWEDPEPSEIDDQEEAEIQEKIDDQENKKEDPEENPEEEKLEDPEKEAGENGGTGLPPAVRIMGGIAGGLALAAIILPRIDPRFKEIIDKLNESLAALGSKKSPSPKDPRLRSPTSFGQGGFNRRF